MLNNLFQACISAVVHVWRSVRNVAQCRGFERAFHYGYFALGKTAFVGGEAGRGFQTDVVKTVIGKIKTLVTFFAFRLAFKQHKAALDRCVDSTLISPAPLIER